MRKNNQTVSIAEFLEGLFVLFGTIAIICVITYLLSGDARADEARVYQSTDSASMEHIAANIAIENAYTKARNSCFVVNAKAEILDTMITRSDTGTWVARAYYTCIFQSI